MQTFDVFFLYSSSRRTFWREREELPLGASSDIYLSVTLSLVEGYETLVNDGDAALHHRQISAHVL
jgi:hypothetical protein